MNPPKISESEWSVMELLWERSPLTASEVARALLETTGWAENTVRTLLTRLLEKGVLKVSAGSPRLFSPAVSRTDCVQAESSSFMARFFQGATQPLLVHFARNARLSPEEIAELKRVLDESIESQNPN
ncbi:BlaI/MecI/CopY family transcriptional regulator [Luteolibacter ambystomatis]|uniref:BlaI/MecI/CopY family transcriptional regulator n=1 Tax=Luteolibacter ambystomatis TaxID=2824561 RepID=A0A975PFV0_9BACT|nr:BlaI/MecI/CopY family transcriptional regulator [Luteolibacter ambystomatis]QUE52105.1 BlaI/MecI/CopY family transcriptional regulator [Luteolibacter ambystomatis]